MGIGLGIGSHSTQSLPAAFGFQMNERNLSWDDSAARQLIRMTLSNKLNISMEEVDQRLDELGVLVPGGGMLQECSQL